MSTSENKKQRKLVVSILAAICILPSLSSAQLINSGATIIATTDSYIVLDNLSLQNDGVFNQTAGTVSFTGNADAAVTGTNAPLFYRVNLNKTGAALRLQTGITINNELRFNNGLLDLNNNVISLDPAALLNSESETSHLIGPSGGYVQITSLLNAPSSANPGSLGVWISSPQNLGSVTIRRGHQSQTNNTGGGNSVLRYFDIIPANNTALNATLRISYLQAELNGLNENSLTIWKSNDNVTWSHLGRTSNSTVSNFVELTGINDLTRFTLSTPGNTLPLIWSSFNTQCISDKVRISWETAQEQNTKLFIIKRSVDGTTWTDIASLPAAGNSNTSVIYSWTDAQPLQGNSYYMIEQHDFDGRTTVSPVLLNDCGQKDGLKVYPNPVVNNCWVNIQSVQNSTVTMRLYDNKGQLVQQRREPIQTGNNQLELQMNRFAKGIYSLVITWVDGKVKVARINKQ